MDDINKIILIAEEAGKIIMSHYQTDTKVEYKEDEFDPVTVADKEADDYIRKHIQALFPDDDILSEENDATDVNYDGRVWMVDPLDGTKYFVRHIPVFNVSIGLCIDGSPSLGVVFNPVTKRLYYAIKGQGAFMRHEGKTTSITVTTQTDLPDAMHIIRTQLGDTKPFDTLINKFLEGKENRIDAGSCCHKLCMVARGQADTWVSPSIQAKKWDTCAAQAILEEAGGRITNFDGSPLDYKKETLGWDKSYIVTNGALHEKTISELNSFK